MIPDVLQSSDDSGNISKTVAGLIVSLTSLILTVAQLKGWTITASQVTVAASEIGVVVGAVVTLYGFVLKVISWITKWANKPKPTVSA